jgi:hypothetical protein
VGSEIGVACGSLVGGSGSALYIYDAAKKKLGVYFLGNNGLELRAMRDIQFDMLAPDFNGKPGTLTSVAQMRKAIDKATKSTKKDKDETE